MEHENLAGDAKGKGTNGYHREAESTDAPEGGGPPRSSDESSVMGLERPARLCLVHQWVRHGRPEGAKALVEMLS